jgi:hypothetical protein
MTSLINKKGASRMTGRGEEPQKACNVNGSADTLSHGVLEAMRAGSNCGLRLFRDMRIWWVVQFLRVNDQVAQCGEKIWSLPGAATQGWDNKAENIESGHNVGPRSGGFKASRPSAGQPRLL